MPASTPPLRVVPPVPATWRVLALTALDAPRDHLLRLTLGATATPSATPSATLSATLLVDAAASSLTVPADSSVVDAEGAALLAYDGLQGLTADMTARGDALWAGMPGQRACEVIEALGGVVLAPIRCTPGCAAIAVCTPETVVDLTLLDAITAHRWPVLAVRWTPTRDPAPLPLAGVADRWAVTSTAGTLRDGELQAFSQFLRTYIDLDAAILLIADDAERWTALAAAEALQGVLHPARPLECAFATTGRPVDVHGWGARSTVAFRDGLQRP